MYEQAQPVPPQREVLNEQTSVPPSLPPPVHQSGRVYHGNDTPKKREEEGTSSDTYEERVYYTLNPENISPPSPGSRLQQATLEANIGPAAGVIDPEDNAYQGSATSRHVACDVIRNHVRCMAGTLAVIVTQATVVLVLMMFINAQQHKHTEEISQLSRTVDDLKRSLDIEGNRTAIFEQRLAEEKTLGK
ncbi:uncharacterized protein [Branchiostoma lanceolatum]|uniref:uncharacterized protein n=1 Tax=Branchiostoma lanceolatum TaxID=7740 RepID=UPI003452C3CE